MCAVISAERRRMGDEQAMGQISELFPLRHYVQPASAGLGDFNDDDSYVIVDLVKRPPAGATFLVTLHGDSMEPTYQDGQWLFVRAQETIRVGEIGLFAIDSDLYIKEYGTNGLISHNDKYPIKRPGDDDTFKVYGKVLGVCTDDYFGK